MTFKAIATLKKASQRRRAGLKPEDFRAPEAGKVIRSPRGVFAFVPAPPPPAIRYDEELVLELSKADAAFPSCRVSDAFSQTPTC